MSSFKKHKMLPCVVSTLISQNHPQDDGSIDFKWSRFER